MYQFRFRFLHLLLLLVSLAFYAKVRRVANIQALLAEQSAALGSPEQLAEYGQQFKEAFQAIKGGPPAILLLNKFALNISLNFFCNLRNFSGAAERLVFVVFDAHSREVLRKSFPELAVIHWHLPALEGKFSSGQAGYQLFQFFRAKLAAFLVERTSSFWMIQADTIWRQNLFQLISQLISSDTFRLNFVPLQTWTAPNIRLLTWSLTARAPTDCCARWQVEGWPNRQLCPFGFGFLIAGGYFFVRSSEQTKQFFDSVAQFLLDHFATDNNVFARQCILALFGNKCAQIPYSVISNWRSGTAGDGSSSSPLFQFDGGDGAGDKFQKMRVNGHLYVDPSTIPQVAAAEGGQFPVVKCLSENSKEISAESGSKKPASSSNHLMTLVHLAFEFVHARFPGLKDFLLAHLFPLYAAYLFV